MSVIESDEEFVELFTDSNETQTKLVCGADGKSCSNRFRPSKRGVGMG